MIGTLFALWWPLTLMFGGMGVVIHGFEWLKGNGFDWLGLGVGLVLIARWPITFPLLFIAIIVDAIIGWRKKRNAKDQDS
jgi:hypothetical protein